MIVGVGVVAVVITITAKCVNFHLSAHYESASLPLKQNLSTLELNVIKQEWEVWFYQDGPTKIVTIPFSQQWISHTNVIITGTYGGASKTLQVE